MPYILRPMTVEDVDEVVRIERQSFSLAWPSSAYRRELRDNRMASYLVAERVGRGADRVAAEVEVGASAPEPSWLQALRSLVGRGRNRPGTHLQSGELVGYAGLWLMVDEAHITTIAVHPDHRGKGIGDLLMVGIIEKAMEVNARWVTLEVRKSNEVAQNLYRKFSFHAEGLRRGYYSDNNEDAVIMWSDEIRTDEFKQHFRQLKESVAKRIAREDP